jgi:hypothetical protein
MGQFFFSLARINTYSRMATGSATSPHWDIRMAASGPSFHHGERPGLADFRRSALSIVVIPLETAEFDSDRLAVVRQRVKRTRCGRSRATALRRQRPCRWRLLADRRAGAPNWTSFGQGQIPIFPLWTVERLLGLAQEQPEQR